MLKRLDEKFFDQVFQIMEKSFPKDEYRTYEEQKALFAEPCYQIYGLTGPGVNDIKAFAAVWEFESICFLEHFAVDPRYRNDGIGSKILKELSSDNEKMLCLEVELPETELAKRRISFYERNGFFLNTYPYEQPALSKGQGTVPLYVMTYGKAVEETEFQRIKKELYREVYKMEDQVDDH